MSPFLPLRRLGRLLLHHLTHGVVPWRWLLLPLGVAIVALTSRSWVTFDYVHQRPRDSNLWDLLPYLLCERPGLLWAFGLGFSLVAGDSLIRARTSGAAALTLIRGHSRTAWWSTHLGAVGLQALAYATVASASILLVALFSFPFSLEPSATARAEVLEQMLYPRWSFLSMPVFSLAIAARTALGLWLAGSVLSLSSLFSSHPLTPLLLAAGWLLLSAAFFPYHRSAGLLRWLDLSRILSYVEHFKPGGLVRRGVVLRELAGTGEDLGVRLAVTAEEHAPAVAAWAAEAKADLRRLPDERGRPVFRLGGTLPSASRIVRELVGRGVGVEEVGPVRRTLEEVFLSIADES